VAAGRRLSRASALDRLVERYLDTAVFGTARGLGRLLGIPVAEVANCVARLTRRGVVVETAVAGWPGRWLVGAAPIR